MGSLRSSFSIPSSGASSSFSFSDGVDSCPPLPEERGFQKWNIIGLDASEGMLKVARAKGLHCIKGGVFERASKYEYMFWDMAYRMERWPI